MTTVLGQHCQLLRAGKQTEPPHTDNVNATTDNLAERREAAFLPG
jgi:hypothetical protein